MSGIIEGTQEELEQHRLLKEKEQKISKVVDIVKQNSIIFERVVDRLVDEFCDDLDSFVNSLNYTMRDLKLGRVKSYSQLKLEMRCLELATSMYKATDGLATLGSQSDVAKSLKAERFDRIYSERKGSGTIPDKTAEVNSQIINEILVDKIMERAYKVIGQKVKSANRLLESIKKVLTSRMIMAEVWRKEAPIHDTIDSQDLEDMEPDQPEEVF
jgi:hypothetical protein